LLLLLLLLPALVDISSGITPTPPTSCRVVLILMLPLLLSCYMGRLFFKVVVVVVVVVVRVVDVSLGGEQRPCVKQHESETPVLC
jgi:hypothetical protein